MVRFAAAIFDRKLVTDSTAAEMFRVQPDSEGRASFTAGWSIDSTGPRCGLKSVDEVSFVRQALRFPTDAIVEGSTAYLAWCQS